MIRVSAVSGALFVSFFTFRKTLIVFTGFAIQPRVCEFTSLEPASGPEYTSGPYGLNFCPKGVHNLAFFVSATVIAVYCLVAAVASPLCPAADDVTFFHISSYLITFFAK